MKKNRKIVLTVFIALLTIFCISGTVEASYSASGKTVNSGESVIITITSTEKLENFDVACTDTGGLTYNSCSTSVAGAIANPSAKKISYAMYGGEATNLGTYTFTAPKVTEETKFSVKFIVNDETIVSTITVEPEKTNNTGTTDNNTGTNNSGGNTGSNSGTTNNNSGSTNNGSTNNNAGTNTGGNSGTTTEKSTNAYLSTLGVRPAEYDFSGFSKTKYEYNVTVPNDVNSLQVLYKTADSNAKVKMTGNSGLEVGSNNEIKLVVTAEDGKTTKTYTIKVTKLAEEEEKPGNIIEDEEGLYLTSLDLEGIELSPAFAKDTYSYTATLNKNLAEIKVNAIANKENASVEISGNTDLVIGENTINILVKKEDSLAQTVYQITLTKEVESIVTPTDTEESNLIGDIMESINKYVIIAVGLVLIMIVAVVVLIILLRKENKRLKEEDTEEYDVYQNDENEFEDNQVQNVEEKLVEDTTNETETKNERKSRRREKGRHSK